MQLLVGGSVFCWQSQMLLNPGESLLPSHSSAGISSLVPWCLSTAQVSAPSLGSVRGSGRTAGQAGLCSEV